MPMFDTNSGTVSIEEAAKRLGIGRSLAYDQAHTPDGEGRLWLCDGVRILQIGGRFRVVKKHLDELLGPDAAA